MKGGGRFVGTMRNQKLSIPPEKARRHEKGAPPSHEKRDGGCKETCPRLDRGRSDQGVRREKGDITGQKIGREKPGGIYTLKESGGLQGDCRIFINPICTTMPDR